MLSAKYLLVAHEFQNKTLTGAPAISATKVVALPIAIEALPAYGQG